MSLTRIIGDNYHRYAYRHIANASGKITDKTDFALSDTILGISLVLEEYIVCAEGP